MCQKLIKGKIDFETPSDEAICLHEAGHACAALLVGVVPAFLEFTNDPSSPGIARNRISTTSEHQRKFVACGAYAVELSLFQANRLVDRAGHLISERDFIQIAVGHNASHDKHRFFGVDLAKNGVWPAELDTQFMSYGLDVSKKLPMDLVFSLAEALLNERRIECERIRDIARLHLPADVTDRLTCPKQNALSTETPIWRKIWDRIKPDWFN